MSTSTRFELDTGVIFSFEELRSLLLALADDDQEQTATVKHVARAVIADPQRFGYHTRVLALAVVKLQRAADIATAIVAGWSQPSTTTPADE